MKACGNCKHFKKFYSLDGTDQVYEGVGRCTNEKSMRCDYIEPDFRKCEKFSLKKSK